MKQYGAAVCLAILGLAGCGGGSGGKTAEPTTSTTTVPPSTTTTTNLRAELASFCVEVGRVYRDEAQSLSGPLVDDTLRLIDVSEGLAGTGPTGGLDTLRTDARKGPVFASIVVTGMQTSMCKASAAP